MSFIDSNASPSDSEAPALDSSSNDQAHDSKEAASRKRTLKALIGHPIDTLDYYERALSHRSLTRGRVDTEFCSNERLEFLGDAILGAEVAEALFQQFPTKSEGYLTRLRARLVRRQALAHCARRLELGDHLRMSPNAAHSGGRDNPAILSDAFEALIGAIYLDQGAGAARTFIHQKVLAPVNLEKLARNSENYKSQLLEHMQAEGRPQPQYRIAREEGPAHAKVFTVEVLLDGSPWGTGTATSKKKAEQEAAGEALRRLQEEVS